MKRLAVRLSASLFFLAPSPRTVDAAPTALRARLVIADANSPPIENGIVVVVEGNPLDDPEALARVRFVMKSGSIYRDER